MQSIAPGNHLPGNQLPNNPLPSNKARATAATQVASEITLSYDANGNLIDDGEQFTFEYDANDKLKIVRDRATTAVVAEYRYDALGRRVEKKVGSDVVRYYHTGEQIVEERDGSDAVVATYTYGDYIDEPLTMDRDSERYYYHTNRMYSVYALTDSAGDLIERYSYTPYGVTTTYDDAYANSQPTSRVDNTYTYTGRQLDSETLLMYYRARTYDPTTGRFRQLDPIGFAGGDLNLYAYAGGRPTIATNPMGLFPPGPALIGPNGEEYRPSCCNTWREVPMKFHRSNHPRLQLNVDDHIAEANRIWKRCCIRITKNDTLDEEKERFANLLPSTMDSGIKINNYDIKSEGAIDIDNVNQTITKLTEGKDQEVINVYIVSGVSHVNDPAKLAGTSLPTIPQSPVRGASETANYFLPPEVGNTIILVGAPGEEGRAPKHVLAHELGHILGLPHMRGRGTGNIMGIGHSLGAFRANQELSEEQCKYATEAYDKLFSSAERKNPR